MLGSCLNMIGFAGRKKEGNEWLERACRAWTLFSCPARKGELSLWAIALAGLVLVGSAEIELLSFVPF